MSEKSDEEISRIAFDNCLRRQVMTAPDKPEGLIAGGEQDAREAAQRIVDWDDAGRLADDEWLVERNETAIIAICRALLSSPVDARRVRCNRGPSVRHSKDEAVRAWNASPTPPTTEGRARAEGIARAFLEHPQDGNASDFVRMGDLRIVCRALLSSPRVEDVRREALEEAAKVADEAQASAREEVESDKKEMGEDYDPYSFGAGFLSGEITASINIATAIRALSPPVKDTP